MYNSSLTKMTSGLNFMMMMMMNDNMMLYKLQALNNFILISFKRKTKLQHQFVNAN